ncbi:hypothetical protein [Cohnella sp. 56]|uniref:hypothetical protein n=1 Tax=Cohnella sp. 56 TaxID=3113722 RepID=UPI0030E9A986
MANMKNLFVKYPLITSFSPYANTLSILGQNNKSLPWVLLNFIQLEYGFLNMSGTTLIDVNFYCPGGLNNFFHFCPYINVACMEKTAVEASLSEFVMKAIDENHYVYLNVDNYYIPYSQFFKKAHVPHSIMLFGYNTATKSFSYSDNLEGGKYGYSTCSFEELNLSHASCAANKMDEPDHSSTSGLIYLLSINNDYEDTITLGNMADKLEQYLYPTASCSIPRLNYEVPIEHIKFGIGVYDFLSQYTVEWARHDNYMDVFSKNFHVLHNHKLLLTEIGKVVSPVIDMGLVAELYEIQQETEIIMNLYLKYRITKNIDLLKKIEQKLSGLKQKESDVLVDLREALEAKREVSVCEFIPQPVRSFQ